MTLKWPRFEGELLLGAIEPMFHLILQEKLQKPVNAPDFKLSLALFQKEDVVPEGGFIYFPGWYHFFIKDNFINNHYKVISDQYNNFIKELNGLYSMSADIFDGEEKLTVRSAMFTFYFKYQDGIAMFQMNNETLEELTKRTESLFNFMQQLSEKEVLYQPYLFTDRVFYFSFLNGSWNLVDPLYYVADSINQEFILNTDSRVNKPDILLHEANINKKFTFRDNWVLNFDGLSTLMARPNDVAIYASICDRNLVAAKKFYDDTILPRRQYHHGPFPSVEQQREYFDYFELITTSLIFSFTAIEAFVNMIIPDSYELTTAEGLIHDKVKIERSYSLTKKLTRVLIDVLKTPNPKLEAWWSNLESLQNLRDQTIHTKQSYSEERYSRLLQQDVFELIKTYRHVISHYGQYIKKKCVPFDQQYSLRVWI